ncbi:hypothetical protein [Rhodoferax ferrireducens]|nr:hypothetical protein [Rhodoferax ferrireducens]
MSGITILSAEAAWAKTCQNQGWNDQSKIVHLEGFIREMSLFEKFETYFTRAACQENEDCAVARRAASDARPIAGDPRLVVLERLGYDVDTDDDQPGKWIWTSSTDGCDSSFETAQAALDGAWADAVRVTWSLLDMPVEQWAALSLEQQIEAVDKPFPVD